MNTHTEFVKEQLANQERLGAKFAAQPHRAGLHYATANRYRELINELERLHAIGGGSETRKVNVTLKDLDGLPPELMNELSISESDRQEMVIEDIIAANGGVISLDKLIIAYYRRCGDIFKRNTLTSRLYRMAEKGMIFNVPGKRGYYSTSEMAENDVRRIFGQPVDVADADEKLSPETPQDIGQGLQRPIYRRGLRRLVLQDMPSALPESE